MTLETLDEPGAAVESTSVSRTDDVGNDDSQAAITSDLTAGGSEREWHPSPRVLLLRVGQYGAMASGFLVLTLVPWFQQELHGARLLVYALLFLGNAFLFSRELRGYTLRFVPLVRLRGDAIQLRRLWTTRTTSVPIEQIRCEVEGGHGKAANRPKALLLGPFGAEETFPLDGLDSVARRSLLFALRKFGRSLAARE